MEANISRKKYIWGWFEVSTPASGGFVGQQYQDDDKMTWLVQGSMYEQSDRAACIGEW